MLLPYMKKRGSPTCYSSHVWRPSHCPSLLNEQRRSPRRYVNLLCATIVGNAVTRYYIPMDIYRCLIPDRDERLRSFQTSRTKRQVNALSYMNPHPSGLLLSQKIHLMGMLQIYNFILKVQKETDKILCNSLQQFWALILHYRIEYIV